LHFVSRAGRSKRLTDSAVCLVADEGGFDLHLERFLKQHKQIEGLGARVVEGEPLPDPGAFSRRMSKLLQANLPPAA
jgi:molecular chaperone HtpG